MEKMQRLSATEVAKQSGVSVRKVQNIAKRVGLVKNERGFYQFTPGFVEFIKNGQSQELIATETRLPESLDEVIEQPSYMATNASIAKDTVLVELSSPDMSLTRKPKTGIFAFLTNLLGRK